MIGIIVRSSPYSSSGVKEVLRAAVAMSLDDDVEVLLIGPGESCLDVRYDDWADEIEEHVSTVEELGTLSVGHGRLRGLLDEAEKVVAV
ncbi:MAG: hypothetical protein MAG715_00437 [Methanonatronarchaeales archaeon]|nr:hypothetical protein [Methanonatronarchaeales archaeon]